MKRNLTFTRTLVQFTQYGDVKRKVVNAPKLAALNIIKSVYGRVPISILHEYKSDSALVYGQLSDAATELNAAKESK